MLFGAKAGGHQGAPGGHWAPTMVIGGGTEKSQNVPHVDIQTRVRSWSWRLLFCTLAICFGACFSLKVQRGRTRDVVVFEGST